ncbi:phage tail protein [Pectobacterium brasiliense]
MPQLFPGAVAPAGWLKCNGQQFDTAQFPVLASRYPSGFLPDLRGEFVRGWDDGRGVDVGRTLLGAQIGMIESHNHMLPISDPSLWNGAVYGYAHNQPSATIEDIGHAAGSTSRELTSMTGGSETRPRNIAFNYIVRAA